VLSCTACSSDWLALTMLLGGTLVCQHRCTVGLSLSPTHGVRVLFELCLV
jgi:hypothetical protein